MAQATKATRTASRSSPAPKGARSRACASPAGPEPPSRRPTCPPCSAISSSSATSSTTTDTASTWWTRAARRSAGPVTAATRSTTTVRAGSSSARATSKRPTRSATSSTATSSTTTTASASTSAATAPTANDPGDTDTGANGLSNHPLIYNAERRPDGTGVVNGTLDTKPGPQRITLYWSEVCDPSNQGDGATILGTLDVTSNTTGTVDFTANFTPGPSDPAFPDHGYVSAIATPTGGGIAPDGTSEFSTCVALGSGNDSWPSAADINDGSADGAITYDGQTRWYKFTVVPNQQVTIDLSALPADYDLLLFTDIASAYDDLTSSNLTKVSAESSGKGGNLSFSGRGGNLAFSGKGGNLGFSGKGGNLAFSGKGGNLSFSGDVFSGKGGNLVFSGKGGNLSFSGTGTQPKYSAEAYSSAQLSSLIAFSAADGTRSRAARRQHVQRHGRASTSGSPGANGAFDPSSLFHLTVAESPTACDNATNDFHLEALPAVDTSRQFSTIILSNPDDGLPQRVQRDDLPDQAHLAGGPARGRRQGRGHQPRARGSRTSSPRPTPIRTARMPRTSWPTASRRSSIRYRPGNPNLKYVVLVGGDNTIPFFRYPDTADLGAESTFFPPVEPASPSEASLRLNNVLSQDAYGAATQVVHGVASFPVPNLAVGRLVETASDAATVIDAYLNGTTSGTGAVPTPTRSLTTGYDFMTDGGDVRRGQLRERTRHDRHQGHPDQQHVDRVGPQHEAPWLAPRPRVPGRPLQRRRGAGR